MTPVLSLRQATKAINKYKSCRQGKDKSGKTTSRVRPTKGKTVADQFADPSENTGSQGKPVSETEVKPAESKVDPMDKEVEEEVSQAFLNIFEQKK